MSNHIMEIRKKIGMPRAELSRRSGVSARTLEEWERERNIPRDVYLLDKVAQALNVSIYDLIDLESNRPKEEREVERE